MRHLIYWLISMEKMACDVYRASAVLFQHEKDVCNFLNNLADDEAWHQQLMEKALACLECGTFEPPVMLDEDTFERAERPFIAARAKVAGGHIERDELFDHLLEGETSEWNALFLYAVRFVAKSDPDCLNAAPLIQRHEKYIRRFLELHPDLAAHLERCKNLPAVWRDKILFVDDEPIILPFFRKVFEREWSVETTSNGSEALQMLKNDYFDVVVSDIAMPGMNGIALYEEARKIWPDMGGRFLFYSAIAGNYQDYFERNGVEFLIKPVPIGEVKKKVAFLARREIDARLGRAG